MRGGVVVEGWQPTGGGVQTVQVTSQTAAGNVTRTIEELARQRRTQANQRITPSRVAQEYGVCAERRIVTPRMDDEDSPNEMRRHMSGGMYSGEE